MHPVAQTLLMPAGAVAVGPWTPANLGSSLRAWWQMNLLTGSNGDSKTTVPDSSGNGFDLNSVATAATLATNNQNGLNAVRFTAVSQNRYAVTSAVLSGGSAASIYIVYRVISNTVNNGLWIIGSDSVNADHLPFSDSNIYTGAASTVRKSCGAPTATLASYRIIAIRSGANDFALYVDGGTGGSSGGTTARFSTGTNTFGISPTSITLGMNLLSNSFLDGYVGEMFFSNAVDSIDTRQKAEGYLAWKWGLYANLDGTHPYRWYSPLSDGSEPLGVFFRGATEDITSQTTYTFTNVPIGPAAPDRYVHLGVGGRQQTRTITGVTINGVAADQNFQRQDAVSTAGLFTLLVTSGTTATVVVTWSGANDSCGLASWSSRGVGITSTAAYGTAGAQNANGNGSDINLDLPTYTSGYVITYGVHHNAGGAAAVITPNANIAGDFCRSMPSNIKHYGGHGLASGGVLDIRANVGGSTNTNSPQVAMSFSPVMRPADGVGASAAFSFSRDMLAVFSGARYVDTSGAIDTWVNQTGATANNFAGVTTGRPALITAGPNSRLCADFDGTNDVMKSSTLNNFMSVFYGYIAFSYIADVLATNDATSYLNMTLFGDDTGYMGAFVRNNASGFMAYTYDGAVARHLAAAGANVAGTPYVVEWWHDGSSLFACVNGGTPVGVGIFNSASYTDLFAIGKINAGGGATAPVWLNGKVFEMVTCAVPPTNPQRIALVANMMAWVGA